MLLLENIGTSVKVGPNQLPTLHHLLTEAAAILGMEAPDLYVRQVGMFYASRAWIGSARPGGLADCPLALLHGQFVLLCCPASAAEKHVLCVSTVSCAPYSAPVPPPRPS